MQGSTVRAVEMATKTEFLVVQLIVQFLKARRFPKPTDSRKKHKGKSNDVTKVGLEMLCWLLLTVFRLTRESHPRGGRRRGPPTTIEPF